MIIHLLYTRSINRLEKFSNELHLRFFVFTIFHDLTTK